MNNNKKINNLKKEVRVLKRLVAVEQKEIKNLQHFADHDFLTGLYNRRAFVDEVERILLEMKADFSKNGKRRQIIFRNLSLLFIDFDDFKRINDVYGHKNGDKFLELFGSILKESVRPMDIIGRWGGDEFVVLLLGGNKKSSEKVAKRIMHKLKYFRMKDVKGMVETTIGISMVEEKNCGKIKNVYELIEKADEAMYKAKNTKEKIVFY